MKLSELVEELRLEVRTCAADLEREVTGGYASDLISDVLAHGRAGDLWVTLQTHQNIVAAASLKDLVGIVLVGGREPEEDAKQKAEAERVPLLVSSLPAFELSGRLYQRGLRGEIAD